MNFKELNEKIDTIFWVINMALLGYDRYTKILQDAKLFNEVYPNVSFENAKINYIIDEKDVIFKTSKKEILADHNHSLYKAWQISLGIVGMTSIFEYYLKSVAENITEKSYKADKIFYKFEKITSIKISSFEEYSQVNKYRQVRHISLHNLGRVDDEFKRNTQLNELEKGPYVFFPIDLLNYRDLIISMAVKIENNIN